LEDEFQFLEDLSRTAKNLPPVKRLIDAA
jgi:hypothetical protein